MMPWGNPGADPTICRIKKKTRLVQVANVNLYVGKSSLNHTRG
jgi:hypothetical protein